MLDHARCLVGRAHVDRNLWRYARSVDSTIRRNASDASNDASNDALRILFCGSDQFSITSLNALYAFSQLPGSNVMSIDVACKTDKRTGRGLKIVKPPPIKPVATSLGLPVHQFDTFRGWSLPKSVSSSVQPINMVIAVSFGLLVPPRILTACKFGGLNVHPSMLPHLKGSSPIEHAIMNGDRVTGVTVQTLHPSKFDEGQIVLQTPAPGIEIPRPNDITAPELKTLLADVGAEMLVRALRERLYLDPTVTSSADLAADELVLAPRISPETHQVDFRSMTSTTILRLKRALGTLWAAIPLEAFPSTKRSWPIDVRITFPTHCIFKLADKASLETKMGRKLQTSIGTGTPFCVSSTNDRPRQVPQMLYVKTADDEYLQFSEMGVSGMQYGPAQEVAHKVGLLAKQAVSEDGQVNIHAFNRPLE